MTDRFVTIDTRDHGLVTIPEPAWCTGESHVPHPAVAGLETRPYRAEIVHAGPSVDIMVGTENGPRRLIELLLWRDPFPTPACTHSDDVYVVAHLLDGDHSGYDAAALGALATDLLEAANRVRRLARRLAIETRGGAK